jgi:integrase
LPLQTALRKNEIRTLRWSQIDLFKQTLTVGRTKTEGGSGRLIPLNSVAYAALVRWAGRLPDTKPGNYVFPACEDARLDCPKPNAEKIDPSRPIKSWRTAWRHSTSFVECLACGQLQKPGTTCSAPTCKADIREAQSLFAGLRFHDLRHACITKLAESQASEHTIMAIAGHLSRTMLEHYSHIRMAAKRTALDAIVKQGSSINFQPSVNQNVHQL